MLHCVKDKGVRGQLPPVVHELFQSTCFELVSSAYEGKTFPLNTTHVQYTETESGRQLLPVSRAVKFKKEVRFTAGSRTDWGSFKYLDGS